MASEFCSWLIVLGAKGRVICRVWGVIVNFCLDIETSEGVGLRLD